MSCPNTDTVDTCALYESLCPNPAGGCITSCCTYWLGNNIRVNTLCPGGVYSGQSHDIVEEINSRIPLGRMAKKDDYKAAIVFLLADSSSYMNGATLVIDGGRSVW